MAPQQAPNPNPHRMPMHVQVRTVSGRRYEYDAMFAHAFDAYDDALVRFGEQAARIEVKVIPPTEQRRAA